MAARFHIKSILLGSMLLTLLNCCNVYALSSLAKNDPFPVYKALDFQEYLFTREKLMMKGFPIELPYAQRFGFSLSPFGQNACVGQNFCGERVPLGDLTGRWNMVSLLFDPLPQGKSWTDFPRLNAARTALFTPADPISPVTPTLADEGRLLDPAALFGVFSVPLDYKKRGIRWEFSAMLTCRLGICFQSGAADIVQKVTGFDNLTCYPCSLEEEREQDPNNRNLPPDCCERFRIPANDTTTSILCCGRSNLFTNNSNFTADNVNKFLMYELKNIADEIGLDICNFHDTSIEDLRLSLFWRDAYFINKGRVGWPEFLFLPYIQFGGTIATGKAKKPNVAFSLPFGNNGHHSVGALGGMNFDFIDTIEIGAEIGFTHFFYRDICNLRVPNGAPFRDCQSGIYPFTTDVRIEPGYNWHFAAQLKAYHFLDRLSFFFQYVLLHHENDTIILKKPDPAFQPGFLEASSYFHVQLANVALYYDISPSFSLGFLWQAPITQRNAYRSTTLLFSLNATY